MTTYLGKSCSFCLPRVPFVNCRQFMYLVISLLVLRAGYGIWLYQFLIIAYLFTQDNVRNINIGCGVRRITFKRQQCMYNKGFSYQDTPPLRSLLVCILNFDNKTSKIFSKCNHLFGRYLGETHFVHTSRAVTRLKNKEKQNVIG